MWFYLELQPDVPADFHYPSSSLISGQLASAKLITVCPNPLPVCDMTPGTQLLDIIPGKGPAVWIWSARARAQGYRQI